MHIQQLSWDMEFFDSRSGEILEQEVVQMARKEEMDFMEKFGVYEDATIEECFAETGTVPLGTKWVDVNKGTAENPNMRCRLVARDFKPKGEKDRADLLRFLAAFGGQESSLQHRSDRSSLGLDDVVFGQLPGSLPGMCSRLKRWLCGMRQAASAWERDFVE